MKRDIKAVLEMFVDLLMPDLTPYETVMYIFLLRNSLLKENVLTVRIGKRTIASNIGESAKGNKPAFEQITKILKKLESKGCLRIGDACF